MHICVIGSGYVGLVTAACFAELGVNVTCVDNDERKIKILEKHEIPFYEPGLEEMVTKNMKAGRLQFSTDLSKAVSNSLIIFIAVGTPPKSDGSADLSYIETVGRTIADCMDDYKVIVTKSTVPVGTGKWLSELIQNHQKNSVKYDIVSNPEFLREGSAIEDFMRPNRVVIGTSSDQAKAIMKELYSPLYLIETPIVFTDTPTAEMIKYASNAFLATKISYINEIANLCELTGADVQMVAKGMGLDNRIGGKFLHAGPGYGGSCFPKDTLALASIANDHGYDFKIVKAVVEVNKLQRERVVEKIKKALGVLEGKTIAIMGLAFKPNTDDIRESPALEIALKLKKEGARLQVFDPAAMENAKGVLGDAVYCNDALETVKGADALILAVEWYQFRNIDLDFVKKSLKSPIIIDLKNVYDPERVKKAGLTYYGIGRG